MNTWQERAECLGTNPDVFFPSQDDNAAETLYAKTFCLRCPVAYECYETYQKETLGIYGGTTPRDRARIRAGLPIEAVWNKTLHKLGLPPRYSPKSTKWDHEEILALAARGKSDKEISEYTGAPRSTVWSIIHRARDRDEQRDREVA